MERKSPEQGPESEGAKYLRMLDLGDIADMPIPSHPDLRMDQFLEIPGEGERALPVLKGFESLNPDDPRYVQIKGVLRTEIAKYVGLELDK